MSICSEFVKDTLVVYISGDIDEHTAAGLRTRLDALLSEGGFARLVLNMRGVDFMDSTGIGMIIGRYKKLKRENIPVYVEDVGKQMDKIFKLSGLYEIIGLVR